MVRLGSHYDENKDDYVTWDEYSKRTFEVENKGLTIPIASSPGSRAPLQNNATFRGWVNGQMLNYCAEGGRV